MSAIHRVLEQYWGYTSFRPLQEEVINSVLAGKKDTIALLPTGGGKSICFQVPALASEGICIVISPLIALMNDQVNVLKKKGIKAHNLSGNLSIWELDKTLDSCIYNEVKFLYLSPERLGTHLVRERIRQMKVNLVAIDEAHCVSQWGYDFRPGYLKIAEIRELIPGVPFIALTASANNRVINDICDKLALNSPAVFKQSFYRDNLGLFVQQTEKKAEYMLKVIRKNPGCGLIYVQSRKETKNLSDFLRQNNISADFYHAGLDGITRAEKQQKWLNGGIRIMVCTNAFGMGIDKPDVRFVIHFGIPASIENYYQEAGRGGRDGKKSYAVALVNQGDLDRLDQSLADAFPGKDLVKRVYSALGNHYQVAYGSGENVFYDLDLALFCKQCNMSQKQVYSALEILKHDGLIHLTDAFFQPSRIIFLLNNVKLYEFQVFTPKFEPLIKLLLRSYAGIFEEFVKIDEGLLARKLGTTTELVKKALLHLQQLNVIDYVPQTDKAQVAFATERLREDNFRISPVAYENRKVVMEEQVNAIKSYVIEKQNCRFRMICTYFDEDQGTECGKCDNCLAKRSTAGNDMGKLVEDIYSLIQKKPYTLAELKDSKPYKLIPRETEQAVKWMLEHERLCLDQDQRLTIA